VVFWQNFRASQKTERLNDMTIRNVRLCELKVIRMPGFGLSSKFESLIRTKVSLKTHITLSWD
jgi:hypothetical protein